MKKLIISLLAVSMMPLTTQAKWDIAGEDANQLNAVQSAVPFLTISPDSRSAAMGDVGVATSPDIYSQHWNAAKYAFIDHDMGFAISFIPWLRNLGIDDINLFYLNGYKKFNMQTLSASFRYFTLGDITFTDIRGTTLKVANPNELAIDVAYSRMLSKSFSGGVLFRYIRSDLAQGMDIGSSDSYPGNAFASDISFFYNKKVKLGRNDGKYSAGLNISNIGNKIQYSDNDRTFIPINMRLGSALLVDLDDYNSFTFSIDLNKLLVPTTPIVDSSIVIGKGDFDAAVPVAMFKSFYDAPGVLMSDGSRNIFLEELREVMAGIGVEYWYAKQFAARAGYFYEHASKGNRKYFTLGCGLRLNVFGLDISYLISKNSSPLANTFRFSLQFNMDEYASKKKKR